MPKQKKCKTCGHLQKKHQPYVSGEGWCCTADNCTAWNLCEFPKMRFQLIDVGRNSVNETIDAANILDAFYKAKKHLLSKDVDLYQSKDDMHEFAITAFPRMFGKIKIIIL